MKLLEFLAQLHANQIIKKLKKSTNQEHFDYWYNKGIEFNNYMLLLGIELN